MLLNEPEMLCDANYVNNPAVKTADNGLLFLIYPGGTSGFVVHDGTNIQCQAGPANTVVTLSSGPRRIELQVLGDEPASVTRNGAALTKFTPEEFDAADAGWRADAQTRLIFVKFPHGGGTTTIHF
jgi:hypothetical protein